MTRYERGDHLRHRPELTGFREEVGHDAMGSLPASSAEAAGPEPAQRVMRASLCTSERNSSRVR
jgi:hypothetical protein